MKHGRWFAAAGLALAVGVGTLPAAAQARPGEIPFETYRLDNGMRVILAQDNTAPVVTVNLWYDVGSRSEPEGRRGFAHLFEHLMFEGSEGVDRGDHSLLVRRAGGSDNASQTADRTNYFAILPSNRVNLGLWLEAQRLRALIVTQEGLDTQREVVKEEMRFRVDNSPYGRTFMQALYSAVYDERTCPGYAVPPIGRVEDLDAAELADVQAFHERYYRPNNVTLTVAGAFDPALVRGLIQEHFAPIPGGEIPPAPACVEPFGHLPVQRDIFDTNAQLPAVFMSYGAVPANHPDSYALELLSSILIRGQSSRFNERLVRTEQAAVQTSGFADFRRGPGVLVLFAIANQGVEPAQLQALMEAEVERVRSQGVTAEELEKAQNAQRATTVRGRQTTLGKAEALQWFNHFHGDPGAHRDDLDRYMAVTTADVRRVAQQYLNPQNRALLVTRPGTGEE
jgi:zinc protease